MKKDEEDVQKIMSTFREFNPFGRDRDDLFCISTNDIAPNDVALELLSVEKRGAQLLDQFVKDRLVQSSTKKSLYDKIPQNKAKTFSTIHQSQQLREINQVKTFKGGRNLFRRLLSAAQSGREVTLPRLLTHELNPTPPALSTTDGQLRVTNKSSLLSLIAAPHELNELPTPTTNDKICVILHGMALVQAIGKPCKCGPKWS